MDSSFGRGGAAGLPVREGGFDYRFPPGPGDDGSLLAPGPSGSVYVGGYARSKAGVFLVARMSTTGRLVQGFGHGGLTSVPAIYSVPEKPPRMLALGGGGLLVVGLDHAHHLVAVRLRGNGAEDHGFGHDGVAKYALADTNGHAIIAAAVLEPDGDLLAVYYQKEVPEPVNEPRITAGLGAGTIGFVRLLPSGRLDSSFGKGGFLQATGQPPPVGEFGACGASASPSGSVLLAYEQAATPNNGPAEPAVQELAPTGADATGFGQAGVAYLPFTPVVQGTDSVVSGGLFARRRRCGGQLRRRGPARALHPWRPPGSVLRHRRAHERRCGRLLPRRVRQRRGLRARVDLPADPPRDAPERSAGSRARWWQRHALRRQPALPEP